MSDIIKRLDIESIFQIKINALEKLKQLEIIDNEIRKELEQINGYRPYRIDYRYDTYDEDREKKYIDRICWYYLVGLFELEKYMLCTDYEKMMKEILSALDSFDMAFANKEHWEKIDKDWQDGITSIYQQFLSGLAKSGIEKIDETDVSFDPNIHQSISLVETEDESKNHTIAQVLQAGYKVKDHKEQDRVIRPAKVSIFEYHNQP